MVIIASFAVAWVVVLSALSTYLMYLRRDDARRIQQLRTEKKEISKRHAAIEEGSRDKRQNQLWRIRSYVPGTEEEGYASQDEEWEDFDGPFEAAVWKLRAGQAEKPKKRWVLETRARTIVDPTTGKTPIRTYNYLSPLSFSMFTTDV